MSISGQTSRFVAAAVLFALVGCAPAPAKKQPSVYVGTLAVIGKEAYVNRRPAYTGAVIYDNDIVSTGPGTSAKIYLQWGGFVQLDENTDPLFELLREGACLLVEVAKGQAYVDAENVCLDDNRNLESNTQSQVNLSTDGAESTLTVVQGHVRVTSPGDALLQANDQYSVDANGRGYRARLTPEQTNSVVDWVGRYPFPPAPPQTPRPPQRQGGSISPPEVAAISAIFWSVLNQKGGGNHGHSPGTGPSPTAPGAGTSPRTYPPGTSDRTDPSGTGDRDHSPYQPSARDPHPAPTRPPSRTPPHTSDVPTQQRPTRAPACDPRTTPHQIEGRTQTHCPRSDTQYSPQRQPGNGGN
jgi:hypothetical protein